jgi:hypothetical protein
VTVRAQILEQMLSDVNSGSPSPLCIKDRGLEVAPGPDGAMTMRPGDDVGERVGPQSAVMSRTLLVLFECRAQADDTATATERLEPMLERIVARLGGSRLGGLVRETLDVRIKFEQVQGDVRYAKATVFVTAKYQTLVNDATRRT